MSLLSEGEAVLSQLSEQERHLLCDKELEALTERRLGKSVWRKTSSALQWAATI